MSDIKHIVENIEEILEAAKKVKSIKGRYLTTQNKEQEARDAVKSLQVEAHTITTAMVNGEDMSKVRDLSVVQREMLRAHNRVDAAIDKSHLDVEAMEKACKALKDSMSPTMVEIAKSLEAEQEGHGPAIHVIVEDNQVMDQAAEA